MHGQLEGLRFAVVILTGYGKYHIRNAAGFIFDDLARKGHFNIRLRKQHLERIDVLQLFFSARRNDLAHKIPVRVQQVGVDAIIDILGQLDQLGVIQ